MLAPWTLGLQALFIDTDILHGTSMGYRYWVLIIICHPSTAWRRRYNGWTTPINLICNIFTEITYSASPPCLPGVDELINAKFSWKWVPHDFAKTGYPEVHPTVTVSTDSFKRLHTIICAWIFLSYLNKLKYLQDHMAENLEWNWHGFFIQYINE